MAKIKVRREGNLLWEDECEPLTQEQMTSIKSQFHPSNTANVNIVPYEIYSPEEHVVGEWREMVDGVLKKKPVYAKIVTTTVPSTPTDGTESTKVLISDNTIKCIHIFGQMFHPSNGSVLQIPLTYNGFFTGFLADTNARTTIVNSRQTFSGRNVNCYISYTKTTDEWQPV